MTSLCCQNGRIVHLHYSTISPCADPLGFTIRQFCCLWIADERTYIQVSTIIHITLSCRTEEHLVVSQVWFCYSAYNYSLFELPRSVSPLSTSLSRDSIFDPILYPGLWSQSDPYMAQTCQKLPSIWLPRGCAVALARIMSALKWVLKLIWRGLSGIDSH